MGIARRLVAGLARGTPLTRRAPLALVALVVAVAGAAWSATPACACGGGPGYDVYEPFTDLASTVDFDGEGADLEGANGGPHAFRFSFLAPVILADSTDPTRADELDDLTTIYDRRSGWHDEPPAHDSANRPALTDSAFLAALRQGALDRAAAHARALVDRTLDMPAALAQEQQPLVQRAVEFLELRPQLAPTDGRGVDGRILARFFAAPPAPRDSVHLSGRYDSAEVDAARLRAWQRAQVARVPDPVPSESLPPVLRGAAALRALPRAALAEQATVIARSPRVPSLRFVGLQERTRALIPAGWPADDTTRADSLRRRALRADYAAWLAAYPTHPLADLVRLYTVRADRLVGDSTRMWTTLFAMYPRHRARVLAEMYALLVAGENPPAAIREAITDPLLRSAFVFRTFGCESYGCSDRGGPHYDRARWDTEWRRAAAARPAAWAVNAEERLLRVALADSIVAPLPSAFPAAPDAPTPLWGTLRLAVLLRAAERDPAHWSDADAQAALLPAGRTAAALRLRLALHRGQWSRPLGDSTLHPDTRRYLLQVLAPDSVLAAIASAPDRGVRDEAIRVQAVRLAGLQRWRDAARTARPANATLADSFDRAATLAADRSTAGQAALARYLVGAQGELLGGVDDRSWYRTIEARWLTLGGDTVSPNAGAARPAAPGVPWTVAEERRAARHYLLANSELYFALGAYASALRALPPTALAGPRRDLARDADVPYNRLINRDYEHTTFWRHELARDSNVATIRRAGKR